MLSVMALLPSQRLDGPLEVLRPLWDVVAGRVAQSSPPPWCDQRGWSDYLISLTNDDLALAEQHGLDKALPLLPEPPTSLGQLCRDVARLVDPYRTAELAAAAEPTVHVPLRKRAQVAAVLEACRADFASARRVVEVGAGCGHATRALAGQLSLPVFGIDRDPVLVERARQLLDGDGVSFSVADGETELELCAGDLVVGLHACGGLGDALLRQAAEVRAHVLLVSCCLQKIAADPRQPLSATGRRLGLSLPKSALGLTNLAPFSEIGHADVVMRGRQARHALRLLLAARGKPVPPGQEARGIHRREFRRGLAAVAGPALELRGLAPATDSELGRFAELARAEHQRMRRLSLPRAMLGRVVELAVVFDRATFLEERGYSVRVEPLFPRSVSPRNLAVLATA